MSQTAEGSFESLQLTFGAADYVVLALLLLICVGIGIYHGFFAGKVTTEDYLVGGRKMKLIPTSLSLIATLVSGTAILGTAADVYINGYHYVFSILSSVFVAFLQTTAFLPVFHELRLTSAYEYLEMRFNKSVRVLCSMFFIVRIMIGIPRFIYTPAVIFNQVTGESLHYGSALVCVVCIFYTCVGGFKAVVWTDAIQAAFMYVSLVVIIIKGTVDVGGLGVVFQRSIEGDRLHAPNFDLDPTIRYTVWSTLIGPSFIILQITTFSQSMMQRYLSIPKLRTALRAVWITNVLGHSMFYGICTYLGLVIYATYHNCDPIETKVARGKDQIVPLFVMTALGRYPSLPGMFVAGVFSAALSTVSSALNSLAAVILEDFCKTLMKRKLTERQQSILMRAVVIVVGIIGGALVLVIEKLGTIMQITLSIGNLTDGPMLGVFIMGFFLPWVTSKGVMSGGVAGMAFIIWKVLGSQAAISSGRLKYGNKPLSVEGCVPDLLLPNATLITYFPPKNSDVFYLYRLSYLWNVPMTCVLTIAFGLLVSYLTGTNDVTSVDPKLLSPIIRKYLPKMKSTEETEPVKLYQPLELQVVTKDSDTTAQSKLLFTQEET